MAFITNPQTIASDPTFQSAVRAALESYISEVVMQDPLWTTGSGSTQPYNKRLNLAVNYIQNGYNQGTIVRQAARLVAELDSNMLQQANNIDLFRFLWQDNPTSRNIFECRVGVDSGYNSVGPHSGQSLYDVLAGITAQDMI